MNFLVHRYSEQKKAGRKTEQKPLWSPERCRPRDRRCKGQGQLPERQLCPFEFFCSPCLFLPFCGFPLSHYGSAYIYTVDEFPLSGQKKHSVFLLPFKLFPLYRNQTDLSEHFKNCHLTVSDTGLSCRFTHKNRILSRTGCFSVPAQDSFVFPEGKP